MLLATQIQSILYHFLAGWVFAFGFSMLTSFKRAFRFSFIKIILEVLYPVIYSALMFYGLYHINGGITNLYLVVIFFIGVVIYYRFYLLVFLQFFSGIKRLLRPVRKKVMLVKSKILGIIKIPIRAYKRRRKNARKKRDQEKEETSDSNIL